ncbi:hypothetical protein [Acinetobacter sp.]|uniref:hypothetical protein n=1 Tax=Acinetobacter sp. TaxID=472 RepID=UPI00388E07FD
MKYLTVALSEDEKTAVITAGDTHIVTLTQETHGLEMMDDIACAIEATARALGAQIFYKDLED